MLQLFFRDTQKTHLCQRVPSKHMRVNVLHTVRNGRFFESTFCKATLADCFQTLVQQHLLERLTIGKGVRANGLQTARGTEVRVL